jgi:CRISPR-associated exonuclease Cas4
MENSFLILAGLALLLALFLFWQSGRQRKASGMPPGRVVYDDSGGGTRLEKALYDPVMNLTGKPDYLVEKGGYVIPVEVKSGWAPPVPYESHVFQLAAYCLLVERSTARRPPYGILRYRNRTFAIDYTKELENRLLELLAEMRIEERTGECHRSHEEQARCERCGYRGHCGEKI